MISTGALDPITGISQMLAHPFMARAFEAGTVIAATCGLVGYFLVLRAQVFTGDALSHVAFTGALIALAIGIDQRVGLFIGCVTFGVAMALLGPRGRADDVVIGNTFAWILGLGVLFLTIYTTSKGGGNGTAGVNVLFGSIFGLSAPQTAVVVAVGASLIAVMAAAARPLLFASIDEAVAAAVGVPVRALGIAFLALVGVSAGEATQAVGALLLLGMLAAPAAAAQRITARPYPAMALSVLLAVGSMWAGLALAYAAPGLPPSFTILAFATGIYVLTIIASHIRRRRHTPFVWRRSPVRSVPPAGAGPVLRRVVRLSRRLSLGSRVLGRGSVDTPSR
ncbi:MAG: metal ABC transporter permease [Acidimicrobiales bacterium]